MSAGVLDLPDFDDRTTLPLEVIVERVGLPFDAVVLAVAELPVRAGSRYAVVDLERIFPSRSWSA